MYCKDSCNFHNLQECSKSALHISTLPLNAYLSLVARPLRVAALGSFLLCHYEPSSLALVAWFSLPSTHMHVTWFFSSFNSYACVFSWRLLTNLMHPWNSSFFFTLLVVFPVDASLYEGKITTDEALLYLRFSQLNPSGIFLVEGSLVEGWVWLADETRGTNLALISIVRKEKSLNVHKLGMCLTSIEL